MRGWGESQLFTKKIILEILFLHEFILTLLLPTPSHPTVYVYILLE